MSKDTKVTRHLPENVIHETMLNSHEPNEMAKRFSSPDYVITHSGGDQIAFSYMNLEAKIFWLPRFMNFIRTAKYNGYIDQHLDTIIYDLSDKSWVNKAKEIMSQSETDAVAEFLEWVGDNRPEYIDPHFTYATYLWRKS